MDGFKDTTRMKYDTGGAVMPSAGASVGSGNRMSAMENREAVAMARQAMAKRMIDRGNDKRMPPMGASVASGNRMSAMENREDRAMPVYKKGGAVKGEAKIGKVMGEFSSGKLHSGSKKGPEVSNPKQAMAIAMSEARGAGAKMPMKKAMGGLAVKPKGMKAC